MNPAVQLTMLPIQGSYKSHSNHLEHHYSKGFWAVHWIYFVHDRLDAKHIIPHTINKWAFFQRIGSVCSMVYLHNSALASLPLSSAKNPLLNIPFSHFS